MNMIQAVVGSLLALILPLMPVAAEAPEFTGTTSELDYFDMGVEGFKFRWTPDDRSDSIDCQNYAICAFGDILGPDCPGQIFVALEFYDENGERVNDGGDIIEARGKRRFMGVELGTNRDITFDTFNVVDIFCGKGLPTGRGEV